MQKLFYTIGVVLIILFSSCEEYEMVKYEAGGRINFYGFDKEQGYAWDDVKYLNDSKNFGINKQGENLEIDTVRVGVKVTGEIVDYSRKVAFKVENQTEEGIDVIFRDDYIIPADTGKMVFQVYVKRPSKRNQVCKAELRFDYENCDFEPGTLERQAFAMEVSDIVTMELWGTNQEEWDGYYSMYFGEWSDAKIRFIITTVGAISLPKWEASYEFFEDYLYMLEKFEEYKADHSNPPLLDDNGEWISFPDIFAY